MDKQLLQALDNLSYGLEVLVEALKQKNAKSDTGKTLQSGNFDKSLESITVELKSIKKDTQEILKNQQTIISLQKQKNDDKKSGAVEDASGPKKESQIKKGVSTILLIAVAVLAIGLAFKLVGKIDFLSVIALGAAIYLVSMAFEKVAKLKMSIKDAAITSATMVIMAIGVTLSSWILKKIAPIGITQALTMILIGVGFSLLSPAISKIIEAFKGMTWTQIAKAAVGLVMVLPAIALGITLSSWILKKITPIGFTQALTMILIGVGFSVLSPAIFNIIDTFKEMSMGQIIKSTIGLVIVLPAIALGITLSSWILKKITPISFTQALTAILIAGMFTVLSFGIKRLLEAFGGNDIASLAKAVIFLPLVLPAIALGIVLSSYVLNKTKDVGFKQAFSAIMIAVIFTVISFGLKKIINALDTVDDPAVVILIPILLPAMAAAIWLSSMSLSKVEMMTFGQFFVSLGISILFVVFAVALKIMSPILSKLKPKDIILVPLLMTTMALAVWASSHILKKAADIKYEMMLKILVFSIVFAIAVVVLAAVAWVIGKHFGVTNVLKGSVAIVALATVIMLSSWVISKGTYKKYPDWKWSLSVGLSIAIFGGVAWLLTKLGGITTYIKGGIALLIVAATIMATSHILNIGNYKNYPKLKWAIGVGASLLGFGVAMGVLGLIVSSGVGLVVLAAGAAGVLLVAGTIVAASRILAKGKYAQGKYPSLGWSVSVGLALTAFGAGIVLLGGMIIASFGVGGLMLKAGSNAVLKVAETIVKSSHILAKGTWKKGPTKEWAEGVGIALGAFSPVYKMLMANQIMKIFGGGGVGPKEFSTAIKTVSRGIIDAAGFFAKNKAAFINGPSKAWSEGVGMAIGAFAPVYKMLMANQIMKIFGGGGVGPKEFSTAIRVITKGIISSAYIFAKNKAPFKEGNYPSVKWGKGVGAALGAFAPVFKALSKDTGWFTSGDEVINNMVNGVVKISKAIVRVANIFSFSKANWDSYPTKKWSFNVKNAVGSFIRLVKSVTKGLEYDAIVGVVLRMKKVSRILSDGKFSLKIDPNYFKTVGKNILDFNNVVKKIAQSETLGSKISSFISGNDPIIQVAKRMVILSKGYDALAKSLIRLGSAMKTLNIKNLQQLGSIRGLSSESVKSSEVRTPSFVSSVTSRLFGKDEQGSSIKSKRSSGAEDKKNQISYVSNQLEKVVKILTNIDKTASTIDEYIAEYIAEQGGNIKAPEIET